jgi:protein-S-isoprenylcysteine O-methyltransferase Ste14
MCCFNAPTWSSIALGVIGGIVSTPVLIRGFKRRGKGVFYEHHFLIQRAPQLACAINFALMFWSFGVSNNIVKGFWRSSHVFSLAPFLTPVVSDIVSWLGVLILASGLVFMIGGWYSLGESFSTDAEVLEGHKLRKNGLLQFVMHPAYSGIIQSLLGSSLAAVSPIAVLFNIFVVAPLWLNRAKYEEKLLVETFGQEYQLYGKELKWRRLVPVFLPFGV